MKTRIKTIAEGFNLYTAEDIPETHKASFNRGSKGELSIFNNFVASMPGVEYGKFYECRKQDNRNEEPTYYIEHVYNLYLPAGCDYLLMLKDAYKVKDKFRFYPYYSHFHKFNNISNSIKNEATQDIKEPQNIGVFTEKKVFTWFEYCKQYMDALNSCLDTVNGKNQDHLNLINDFCSQMSGAGAKVTRSNDQTTAWIETKLFKIKLELLRQDNYLQKSIVFNGSLNDVINITKSF